MQILTVKGGMEALNALLLKDTRGKRYNRRKVLLLVDINFLFRMPLTLTSKRSLQTSVKQELMDDLADEVAYEFGDKQPPRFVSPFS
eukprot:SAG11_NODE_91_length_17102_cov_37.671343_8_plen_87_part_00